MGSGLLLVGHGSHLSPHASAPIFAHQARLQARGVFAEVAAGFWREEPSLSRALDGCDASEVTVVPVLIAGGYFTREVIPREMRLAGRVSTVDGRCVRYTGPVGEHPAFARVIVQRAFEAGASGDEALVVLGHGTAKNAGSAASAVLQARRVAASGAFPEVVAAFIDQEPNLAHLRSLVRRDTVVVVPLFIADGWHAGVTIPAGLGLDGGESALGGLPLRYAAAAGTHPGVADVIEEMAAEARTW